MKPPILQLRIIQIAIIVSVLMFIYVLHIIQPAAQSVSATIQWAFVLCAIASAEAGFWFQRKMWRVQSQSLPANLKSTPLNR